MTFQRRANDRCRLETIADAVDVAQLIKTHPRAPGRFARDIDFTPTREQFDAHHQQRQEIEATATAHATIEAYEKVNDADRWDGLS